MKETAGGQHDRILPPTEIMSYTGVFRDTIVGIVHLLGYQFGPHLADIGATRIWRVGPEANYGTLNGPAWIIHEG